MPGQMMQLFRQSAPRRSSCAGSIHRRRRRSACSISMNAAYAAREMEASDKTALEAVMSVNEEKIRLEAKAEQLNTMEGPEVEQLLIDIYEKCGLGCAYIC